MRTTNENKRYPQDATIGILLCFLSFLYLYLGLLVVPILTVIGQLYFIYASRLWIRRYGGKRNFGMAHSLFHLGHPRWVTDWGITLYIAGFYLSPLIIPYQKVCQLILFVTSFDFANAVLPALLKIFLCFVV